MVSSVVYEYVASHFAGELKEVICPYFGGKDSFVNKAKVARMADAFGCVMRDAKQPLVYFGDSGQAYVYNGRYFEDVGSAIPFFSEVFRRAMTMLKVRPVYCCYAPKDVARICVESVSSMSEFAYKPDRRYLIFANGVFDTKDGKLKEFSRRYVSDIVIDMDYNARAVSLLWDRKLKEIIPDKDFRDAFQLFCGSLLINRNEVRIEYVCYLVGPGSNGKSVLAGAIEGVFGARYFSRFTPRQLFKDSDARVNIAALRGKIANLVGDLNEKDISGGDFKRFVSGEMFQGRRNYGDPIQVAAPPLLCCTNALPESADDSHGYHRRQLPVYTTRRQWTEEDKDPFLTKKLTETESRQAIFNWIYAGYKKVMNNGGNIELGEEVREAMEAMRDDSNPQRRWWRDCGWTTAISEETGSWVPLKEVYGDYGRYCEETGEEKLAAREISGLLKNLGVAQRRSRGGMQFLLGKKENE